MANTERTLKVVIDAEDKASKKLGDISSALNQVGKVASIAGVAIVGGLALSVKAAAEAEQQMSQVTAITGRLGAVAKSAGTDINGLNKQIVEAGKSAIKLGFDDEEASLATARLVQTTNSLEIGLKASGLAMDLARAKNISLEGATNAVNLALQGSPKLLRQFGIELDDNATKLQIMTALQEKFGGTATQTSQSFAVQMQALNVQFTNLQETVGAQLIPVLSQLLNQYVVPLVNKIMEFAEANPQLFKTLVLITGGVGALLAVLGPLLLLLPGLIAGVGAFGTILAFVAANPIVLIIAAIVALGVAIFALIKNWEDVKRKTFDIWNNMSEEAKVWTKLLLIILTGGMGAILLLVIQHWDKIKEMTSATWNGIVSIVQTAVNSVRAMIDSIVSAYNSAKSTLSAPLNVVSNFAGKIGKAITPFADGGIVTKPTLGLVGESGPEAIIPLRQAGAMGGGITVNINGGTYLSESVAVDIGNMIVNRLKNVSRITR